MNNDETKALQEELEHFRSEKEKIRNVVGQVGGKEIARRDKILNIIFIGAIIAIFVMDILRHLLKIAVPLPPLFSIELSVLLVSIKIIWMIHKQSKVEHFQFWILNSIEFRLNDISSRIKKIESKKK
jgi:tetrahydromethanopterin S-methyltransferase subunit G